MNDHDTPGMAQETRSPCSEGEDKGGNLSVNEWLYFSSMIALAFAVTMLIMALFRTLKY